MRSGCRPVQRQDQLDLAHPDKIANPDNIKFSEKLRTPFIGGDSGPHVGPPWTR